MTEKRRKNNFHVCVEMVKHWVQVTQVSFMRKDFWIFFFFLFSEMDDRSNERMNIKKDRDKEEVEEKIICETLR